MFLLGKNRKFVRKLIYARFCYNPPSVNERAIYPQVSRKNHRFKSHMWLKRDYNLLSGCAAVELLPEPENVDLRGAEMLRRGKTTVNWNGFKNLIPGQNNIKWLASFVAVIGGVVAVVISVFEYADAKRATAEAQRLEMTKPFLEKQLKLFEDTIELTSRLAITPVSERSEADLYHFESLYWGKLALVEGGDVESKMIAFKTILDSEDADPEKAKKAVLALAHACRDELARNWRVAEWSYKPSRYDWLLGRTK